jgi:hypothetical protein
VSVVSLEQIAYNISLGNPGKRVKGNQDSDSQTVFLSWNAIYPAVGVAENRRAKYDLIPQQCHRLQIPRVYSSSKTTTVREEESA